MILTKTPLRVSFFGGGSDIPAFYNKHVGRTISTTIDKYIYIAANICQADHIKVIYSQLEQVYNVDDVKHDRVREILKYFNIKSNIEICSFSDVNTRGTGLGSSSTFTVGVLTAVMGLLNKRLSRRSIADIACEVEIERCGEPIGKQDQYAAAYGGFNTITYDGDSVQVCETVADQKSLQELNNRLFCFNTGISRSASQILSEQVTSLNSDNRAFDITRKMVDLTYDAEKALRDGDIDRFGSMLDESWQMKKSLSKGISNQKIDDMYDIGMRNGALGGKLLGAGGGGYMMFYMPAKSDVSGLVNEMHDRGYEELLFRFTDKGTTVETKI